jgi:Fe-S cluster assembly ATP-binding protein
MYIIQNLSVSRENNQILSGINLSLAPGSVHVLMGPNGSGKSSLAHALMGDPRYVITSGTISLDERDITTLAVHERARAGLFLAFQYPYELPGVSVFTCLKEAYALQTKQNISVHEFQKLLFEIFAMLHIDHSFANRNLNEGFSGGEKKRFELVQMMLLKPKVAVLDEIDSGLDVDALACVARSIYHAREQNPDMALLIITHYQRLLNYIIPDYVHSMCDGMIIESGDKSLAFKIDQHGYAAV